MAVTYNAAIGATSTTTPSTASLNHAANVVIVINISYIGTTSPNAVTVGGVAATFVSGSKSSSGTNNSNESWYIFRSAAANETVSVGFAAATRVAWNAISYAGAKFAFESLTINNGSGASIQTSTVTPPAGTTNRMLVCGVGGGQTANATGSIVIAQTGSGTLRDISRNLAGSASLKAVSAAFQEYLNNSGTYALTFTLTKSSATIGWVTFAFGLQPSVDTALAPAPMTLTLAGNSPFFDIGMYPPQVALVWTGYAPAIGFVPPTLPLTWTGFAPTLDIAEAPAQIQLVWVGYAPVVVITTPSLVLAPAPMTIVWAGYSPNFDLTLSPNKMPIVWSGYLETLDTGLLPGEMSIVWSGKTPFFDTTLAPSNLPLIFSGKTETLDLALSAGVLPLVLAGNAPSLVFGMDVSPAPMALAWSGNALSFDVGFSPGPLSLVWTGQAPVYTNEMGLSPSALQMVIAFNQPLVLTNYAPPVIGKGISFKLGSYCPIALS